MTRTHWKLRATREERESRGPIYPIKTLVGKRRGCEKEGKGQLRVS